MLSCLARLKGPDMTTSILSHSRPTATHRIWLPPFMGCEDGLDHRGAWWAFGSELLFWVPYAYRTGLSMSENTLIAPLTDLGTRRTECYSGRP